MAGKVNALGQVWSVPLILDGRFWNELSGRTPGTPWFS